MSEFDKNKHLKCVIESHDIHLDSGTLLDNYKTKRAKVKDALNEKFKEKIAKIIHSGSYKKHTAINTKFDMDLCVHFKKGSFSTLKEMYDEVFKFLNSEFEDDDLVEVREQKVSIGLTFNVDGENILFDVTPGRQYNDDKDDNGIYLYINDETDSNRTKTDIHKQVEEIVGRKKERESIKLLKVWKSHHFKIKSFFVELLVMKAFDTDDIDSIRGLWERLKKVIVFIRDNIETVTLIDPGNRSNNVANSLSATEKKDLKSAMEDILEKVEKDATKLKYYFPTNDKYPCKEETYSHDTYSAPAILRKSTFG